MTNRPRCARRLLFAAAIALGPPAGSALSPAFAQAAIVTGGMPGIGAGAMAPAISGITQAGAAADFAGLKGEKGLVLAFVRSADWCPFCKEQLKDLNAIAGQLETRGFPLVALSYDPVATLEKFHRSAKLGYTLVSDPQSAVIDAFGLRNMDVVKNKRMNGIPHPAIYVISADGRILARLSEEGYRKRPAKEVVLKAVDDALATAGKTG
jgi:peroxiredoxin Q/BCP